MKLELVRIGNSWGVRIPKALIEQCGFTDTVDLQVVENRLVISGDAPPREGWHEAFKVAGEPENTPLLLEGVAVNRFDEEEWTW